MRRDDEDDDDDDDSCCGGVCCCLIFSNVLWAVAFGGILLFSRILFDMRDSNAATIWLLRQMGKENELRMHALDDPWWLTHPVTPPTDNSAALLWILEQLGEGEHLEEHPLDDPWWTNRTLAPLNLPFGPTHPISPAVEWILLKLGQEEALRRYNVSDPWWTHRPQTNITLNATNVTVSPMASAYVHHSGRRLSSDGEQPTRLLVEGKVRVTEFVEYFSVPKDGYVKLIVAPESLRYVLKILGMTERPWWDDEYWFVRNNASDVNITNTLNLNHINVASAHFESLLGNDVIVDGTLNTFGTVDFWPSHESPTYQESNARRLFSGNPFDENCQRCASISGPHCRDQCVPHMHVLGGVLGFNNHTCKC